MTTSKILAHGEGSCRRANKLAHLRGTAAALQCVEPTRPDPHALVVWGGCPATGILTRFLLLWYCDSATNQNQAGALPHARDPRSS